MTHDLPANPLSIELTVSHRRSWWGIGPDEPEQWDVSADVWRLAGPAITERHVADISLAAADLCREASRRPDAVSLGEWALEFVETAAQASGRLPTDLEHRISPGPARLLVLRQVVVAEPWRGHGLGVALTAGALLMTAPTARLTVCRVTPEGDSQHGDGEGTSLEAELASLRLAAMLEQIGFQRWRGIHILDLRSPVLADAGLEVMHTWWPKRKEV